MEKRILCVDDEQAIVMVMQNLLRMGGYLPRCTLDPREALEIVKSEGVRVCIVDLRMPAMHGMDLCREIKRIQPGALVFALSAFVDAYSPKEYREAGFEGTFHKPFKIDEILDACRAAFEKLERLDAEQAAKPGPAPGSKAT